ncbi:MAG: dihydrolipoyl dehydrogenase [Verrucomicrobia bacterium]|nr:dihydrolipoyl dehydrogenase [Verrucomicrobiota bacterium]
MYDVAVIGSGPGGYVAAIRCAQLGLKTACIEKNPTLGGTCLNVGCIPSKALLHSSEFYWKLQHEGAKHGLQYSSLHYDWNTIQARKDQVVSGFTKGIDGLFKKNKVDWIAGHATLKSPTTIAVGAQTIEAKSIILATGSEPIPLPFLPFDEKKILSSTGALALSSVPKKLLIVGAGIIGVELGSVYNRLGSEVTFIEFLDRICPGFDLEISKHLLKTFTSQKMTFHLSHKVVSAQNTTLTVQGPEGEKQFTGDAVLVAVGRRPYSDKLGLDSVGIQKDPKGFIPIDASFRTSQPNIFAIGDLVEGPMLAHKASEEGIAVAELIAGHRPTIDYLAIPNVAYTHPEVASVGLTEEEAKSRQINYKTGKFPFKANSRARCTGDDEGFVKMIADAATHRLIGVHIVGPHASELIAEAVLAIQLRATVDQLADTCHAHPTLSEALKEAALAVFKAPIHL